jgi:bifunctional non-homologous end joining protein LigD
MRAPEPMYATIGATIPTGQGWTFEQKYDGMRVIAIARSRDVRLVTQPASFAVFDILQDGRTNLMRRPWRDRRDQLERRVGPGVNKRIFIAESSPNGRRMLARARRRGWEGVIAKRVHDEYVPGARSTGWLKLKLQHRAEFVVGGYTEPRRSRLHIGALLLGYFDIDGRLCYAGHMGGGFNRESLVAMLERLKPAERRTSPFAESFTTNEPAHWVRPVVVIEVKFAEWTADGKLRQPIFLGVRDDKNARDVHKERTSIQEWAAETTDMLTRQRSTSDATVKRRRGGSVRQSITPAAPGGPSGSIIRQLEQIETSGGDGMLDLGRGTTLHVSSLDKPFFPEAGITKGDLMRYYAAVAPLLLPIIKDRPLILRRYPNGIHGSSFFQQNAGDNVPDGVRTARVKTGGGGRADRIIGGDLPTLLYIVQIGTIAVHTWQSRIQTASSADTATIDLDPGEDVSFSAVVALARDIKLQLDQLELRAGIKTSGSSGVHIALPLPPKTTFQDAARLSQAIAERIVQAQPRRATIERSLAKRPAGTIYVDAQQNSEGKSVVAAYSVRERERAPVSAPLDWDELRGTLRIDAFRLDTMPARIRDVGDVWGTALKRRNTKRAIDRVLQAG